VRQMGQEKWWVSFDGWWAEREWDKRNGEWMVVGGELKDSATVWTREMVSEFWWVVTWKREGTWGRRYELEKLKMHTQFQMEKHSVLGTLVDLGLDEILKTMWWTGHEGLQFQLPSAKNNTNSSSAIKVMLSEHTNLGTTFF